MTSFTGGRISWPVQLSDVEIHTDQGLGGIPTGLEVLTLDGALPVEVLSPGDRVITRNSGAARLVSVDVRRDTVPAVEIAAGTLGDLRQTETVVLPASQPVLLRDWRAKMMYDQPQAVAPVGAVVDHGFIRDLGEVELTLHRLNFDRDQVIYAGGLELMSTPVLRQLRPAA